MTTRLRFFNRLPGRLAGNGVATGATVAIKSTGVATFSSVSDMGTDAVQGQTVNNTLVESVGALGIGNKPAVDAALDINGGDTKGLHIRPRTVNGSPTTGYWNKGTLIVDLQGALWFCTQGGTPGLWTKVAF